MLCRELSHPWCHGRVLLTSMAIVRQPSTPPQPPSQSLYLPCSPLPSVCPNLGIGWWYHQTNRPHQNDHASNSEVHLKPASVGSLPDDLILFFLGISHFPVLRVRPLPWITPIPRMAPTGWHHRLSQASDRGYHRNYIVAKLWDWSHQ